MIFVKLHIEVYLLKLCDFIYRKKIGLYCMILLKQFNFPFLLGLCTGMYDNLLINVTRIRTR